MCFSMGFEQFIRKKNYDKEIETATNDHYFFL